MPKVPNLKQVGYSSLRWNERAQRYILPSGKFAAPARIRSIVDADIEHRADRMQSHAATVKQAAQQYQAGAITEVDYHAAVDAFESAMRQEIKDSQLVNSMAAAGGFHNATPSTWGRAGQRTRYNYEKLADFADELKENSHLATSTADGRMQFERRVSLYSDNGRATFAATRDTQMKSAQFKFKQNRLDIGSRHCTGENSCVQMTQLGRVPIDDKRYVLEGFRKCISQCKCETEYFTEAA